jgi:thioredoxin reductase
VFRACPLPLPPAFPPHSAQSERFGTKIFSETVTRVDMSSRPFKVYTDEKEARTRTHTR